jgi:signal transduction histidine kinase
MKIVPKLTAALVGGMCIVLAVNAYRRVRRETNAFDAERMRKDALVGRCVAAAFDAAWRVSGEDGAVAQLATTMASIESLEGRWLRGNAPGAVVVPEDLARAPAGTPIVIRSKGAWYTYVPFDVDGVRRGQLELVDRGRGSGDNARTVVLEAVATAATLVLAAAIVALILNQVIIGRPVHALAEKARRIARGDFTEPVTLSSADELGELAKELNATSARLATTLDQLRHADRLATLGKVAAGVAHELGTPLNVVSARAEMISSGRLSPPEAREYATVITGAVQRMTNTVRQLLQFARRSTVARAPSDVATLARSAIDLVRPVARKQEVDLEVAAEGPAQANVDGGQLQQVVTNLVMNAVHASQPGSSVNVRVEERIETPPADIGGSSRRCVCVDVVDQGHGIDAEALPRLFEPFFTTKDVGEGTGLGLAVSYGIVRDHGGWFRVESKVGSGSKFVVCLPVEEETS